MAPNDGVYHCKILRLWQHFSLTHNWHIVGGTNKVEHAQASWYLRFCHEFRHIFLWFRTGFCKCFLEISVRLKVLNFVENLQTSLNDARIGFCVRSLLSRTVYQWPLTETEIFFRPNPNLHPNSNPNSNPNPNSNNVGCKDHSNLRE